jgi:hypothetical protein
MNFFHQQYIDHYSNWLQTNSNKTTTQENNESNTTSTTLPLNTVSSSASTVNQSTSNTNLFQQTTTGRGQFKKIGYDEVKVFENDEIILYVKKAFHQRQKRFTLQDSLFHIKVEVKNETQKPLLKDLVQTLEEAFTFILNNIKTYFKKEDHNIAYLTLFQEPMVNGLNTGKNYMLIFNVINYFQNDSTD